MPEVHSSSDRVEEASTSRAELVLALSLFAGAAVVGSRLVPFTFFADEGDYLSVGRLMADGQVLYRDLFSHHFPFAYYWAGGVAALFRPSVRRRGSPCSSSSSAPFCGSPASPASLWPSVPRL